MTISGLDDVVAAETILSDVDGRAGRLVIRGCSLDELVGRSRFEDVLALLWQGLVPDVPSGESLRAELGRARRLVFEQALAMDGRLLAMTPVECVRTLLTRIHDGDDLATGLALAAAPAVFTAGALRMRRGLDPLAPDPRLTHAADFLRMSTGASPSAEQTSALDRYLVTVSDHGLNASTFAARVVASTRAGLTSAIVAALSALKGPLHGGAPGPVLDMLDEIGSPERAQCWLEEALDRGDRLMGFGHRIYRVRDPRADALKGALALLSRAGQVDPARVRLAEAVESAALAILARRKPDRPLETNVEFYTALLLESLGFPREAFTCVFAAGRVAGWVAHAREQVLHGRLIRPLSCYVGPRRCEEAKSA